MSNHQARSIPFLLYHMTRIEDICSNVLIHDSEEIYYAKKYHQRLNMNYPDTGNAWSNAHIQSFSDSVDVFTLLEYRHAVKTKTQSIILGLTLQDYQSAINKAHAKTLLKKGSVEDVAEAKWLIDYWMKKTKGELILMPLTRHP